MHIVFAASECVPYAKTGGVAEVVGALPKELVRQGQSQLDCLTPNPHTDALLQLGEAVRDLLDHFRS